MEYVLTHEILVVRVKILDRSRVFKVQQEHILVDKFYESWIKAPNLILTVDIDVRSFLVLVLLTNLTNFFANVVRTVGPNALEKLHELKHILIVLLVILIVIMHAKVLKHWDHLQGQLLLNYIENMKFHLGVVIDLIIVLNGSRLRHRHVQHCKLYLVS